jgi:transcription factor SFP1
MLIFYIIISGDFRLSSSMTGSVESESSRLMKALSESQLPASPNKPGEYLHPAIREKEFCRDFTCCGTTLNDLHALVEHFEDVHVRVVPSEYPFPVPATGGTIPQLTGGMGHAPAGMDPDEMEMDEDAPSPASSNSPPHTPLTQPVASAFDTTSVYMPYRRSSDLAPSAYYGGTPTVQRSHSLGIHANGPGIQPALLTRTPEETPHPSPPATPSSNPKTLNAPKRQITGPIVPNAANDPRPPLPGGKPFRCPTPNCTKSYKQANGLKYHLTHGQCSFLPPDPVLENLTDREADERLRPFICAVGAAPGGKGGGCGRRYKNMNGLRKSLLVT